MVVNSVAVDGLQEEEEEEEVVVVPCSRLAVTPRVFEVLSVEQQGQLGFRSPPVPMETGTQSNMHAQAAAQLCGAWACISNSWAYSRVSACCCCCCCCCKHLRKLSSVFAQHMFVE